MGRTLFGIDLDESPVGGLIEDLLTEEDLEKLADGGQPTGTAPAGDDDSSEGETGTGSETSDSGADTGSEASTDDGYAYRSGADDTSDRGPDTPDPGVGPTDDFSHLRDEAEDEEDGGVLSKIRPHLGKIVAAFALLAVLAVVAWKLLGRKKDAAVDKVSGDDAPDPSEDRIEGDVPEARRRAKAADRDRSDRRDETDSTTERRPSGPDGRDRIQSGTGSLGEQSDTGALVGLAALALIAAVVRKFGEERPHDPLVDGEE